MTNAEKITQSTILSEISPIKHELADEFGVSFQRVEQIEDMVIKTLKVKLNAAK